MKTAVLEINDQNLMIRTEDGVLFTQPGFAQLTENSIETGEQARARAWLKPQYSYHDYWRQLNQNALPTQCILARHHADIAYAQLKQMLSQANSPKHLIIAAPGSFSDEQLSLLLGLLDALGVKVKAVIDTALAACADQKGPTVLVELQLHQAIVSLIEDRDLDQVVSKQEIISNIGVLQIYNSVAHHISETLINNYRYDPLHTSVGAQNIYDQLPEWLQRLKWEKSVSITLPSPQGALALQLQKHKIDELLNDRFSDIKAVIKKNTKIKLCFTHGAILIPTLIKEYAEAEILSTSGTIDNCSKLEGRLKSSDLRRVTSLQKISTPKVKNNINRKVTHLLYDGSAYPLSQPVSIWMLDKKLLITIGHNSEADFIAVVENQILKVLKQQASLSIKIPDKCQPGESIYLSDNKMVLIEVADA